MNQTDPIFYQHKAKIPSTSRGPLARQVSFLEERFATLGPKNGEEGNDDLPLLKPDQHSLDPHSKADVTLQVHLEATQIPSSSLPPLTPAMREQRQRKKKQMVATLQAQLDSPASTQMSVTSSGRPTNYVSPQNPSVVPATTSVVSKTWIPLGPAAVLRGQGGIHPVTGMTPTMSGRIEGIAIAPGGKRLYIASANGGVWRSEDTGNSWVSLMENFDLNPTFTGTDTLACGAIALVAGSTPETDRLYVGTGGSTLNGVGPLVSLDGGKNWQIEESEPSLAGERFYSLTVNPADPNHAIAATSLGLFCRLPDGQGGYYWQATLEYVGGYGCHGKEVVAVRANNVTTFYAFMMFYDDDWRAAVYSSSDGGSWNLLNTGFPTAMTNGYGTLAVQSNNPNFVYALLGRTDQELPDLYRLEVKTQMWRKINITFPGDAKFKWYLEMAVDPANINRFYLAGNTVFIEKDGYCGEVYRCDITETPRSLTATATYIGTSLHADAHCMAFAPGEANKLWIGTDGGLFYTTTPSQNGYIFTACNTGLATLTMNHLGQHPTQDAILFCGSQDNGGLCYTGDEAWTYVSGGDSGYFVINWFDPYKILDTYTYATVRRSVTGGQYDSFSLYVTIPLEPGENCLFYAPLVGTPYNPALLKSNPQAAEKEANLVALGSERPWLSNDFGETWLSIPTGTQNGDSLNDRIKSLAFAAATKLYAGTLKGGIYRFDKKGTGWQRTRLDTQTGLPSNFALPVTDIASDLADASGNSIYVTFGGTGDYRHVWHFNGTTWTARSGQADGETGLLDVQHNAIVVDPTSPTHLYVGADIGVWRSTDNGDTWQPFSRGLPDASVMDLRIHSTYRLLRASTFGRGVFELPLDDVPQPDVTLYIRSTILDRGLYPTKDGLPDPTQPGQVVNHRHSPDIKLSLPNSQGNFPLPSYLNFEQFSNQLVDAALPGTTISQPQVRVYVKVHNRGPKPANGVGVMLIGAPVGAGDNLPPLPTGFAGDVQDNDQLTSPDWQTFSTQSVNDIRPGFPKIVCFTLDTQKIARDNSQLYCLMALAYHAEDPFNATETQAHSLCFQERKAAMKYIRLNLTGRREPSGLKGTTDPNLTGQKDLSGLKNTVQTSSTKDAGVKILVLDGNNYIDLGNRPALQITGSQTLELWLNPSRFENRRNPLAKAYGGEGTITLEKDGSLTYYYGTRGGDGNPYQGFSSSQRLSLNTWSHIAIVRNIETKKLTWYINGEKANEENALYASAKASGLPALLGKGYQSNFIGQLAEVRFWKKACSAAEIKANMNRLLTGKEVGLAAYYRLDDGTGNTVRELVGPGQGTIVGGGPWKVTEVPVKR